MPRLLLLIPALAACSTKATTDGSTDLVEQSEKCNRLFKSLTGDDCKIPL